MFVKPKSGLKVRDPQTRAFLPEAGAEAPQSLYWTRRVRDGDVVVSSPQPAPAPAPMPAVQEARK